MKFNTSDPKNIPDLTFLSSNILTCLLLFQLLLSKAYSSSSIRIVLKHLQKYEKLLQFTYSDTAY